MGLSFSQSVSPGRGLGQFGHGAEISHRNLRHRFLRFALDHEKLADALRFAFIGVEDRAVALEGCRRRPGKGSACRRTDPPRSSRPRRPSDSVVSGLRVIGSPLGEVPLSSAFCPGAGKNSTMARSRGSIPMALSPEPAEDGDQLAGGEGKLDAAANLVLGQFLALEILAGSVRHRTPLPLRRSWRGIPRARRQNSAGAGPSVSLPAPPV